MKSYPMPIGKPVYFEGDILNIKYLSNTQSEADADEEKPFGIFEVDIESPSNIKIPLLQTRIKTKNG